MLEPISSRAEGNTASVETAPGLLAPSELATACDLILDSVHQPRPLRHPNRRREQRRGKVESAMQQPYQLWVLLLSLLDSNILLNPSIIRLRLPHPFLRRSLSALPPPSYIWLLLLAGALPNSLYITVALLFGFHYRSQTTSNSRKASHPFSQCIPRSLSSRRRRCLPPWQLLSPPRIPSLARRATHPRPRTTPSPTTTLPPCLRRLSIPP